MYDDMNRNEFTYGYQKPLEEGEQIYGGMNGTPNNEPPFDESPKKKEKVKKTKERKENGIGKKFLGGMVFGLTAGIVFCAVTFVASKTVLKNTMQSTVLEEAADTEEQEETVIENTVTAQTLPATELSNTQTMSVSDIAQNCMPSIVSITSKSVSEVRSMFGTRQYESESAGSGIIIGQNDNELLIATNNHVVEGAKSLSVCFGDSEEQVYEAKVKGTKASNDLAIVSVDLEQIDAKVKKEIKIATIGRSEDMKIGDTVVAIGNALGYGQSVTTGIVSALNRSVTIDNMSADLIQTDAAINPGNSGGALLNMKGELIGINSAKFASAQVEGMGYAIPIDAAEPILQELMMRQTREKREVKDSGFLGINCQNVDSDVSEMYGIPKGVYVLSVEAGSAAEKAGLKKGDIITEFDGVTITNRDDLKGTLLYYAPGESVKLKIQRSDNGDYAEKEVTVTLDKNTYDEGSSQKNENEMPTYEVDPFDNGMDGYSGGGGMSPFDFFFGN